MPGRPGRPRKRSISTVDAPTRTSPRKKVHLATPEVVYAGKKGQNASKSKAKSPIKPRSSTRIAIKSSSLSPSKRSHNPAPPRTPQPRRTPRKTIPRSRTIDSTTTDSQSSNSTIDTTERTIPFSQLVKFGLSNEELVAHNQLLSVLLNSRSEPIMRKPTWKKTKKAMEASASASSKKAAQDPAPPVMDLAALFDAIGEFPVSNIRQEELEPRVPSVSELHRHAERYWSPLPSSPVPQRDPSPSPSPVSSVKRRKQRMNLRAIRYEDRFPVYPRWKPYDMEENLFPECSRCLSPELCGRNGRVHSCIHRTAARKSSKTVEGYGPLRWWDGIKSYFASFLSSGSKAG